MKKQLLFLFAALLPMLASAEKVEIDGIWYNLIPKGKAVEVTFKGDSYNSYYNEYSGSITIPATVTYDGVVYNVTSIGSSAFYGCSRLTAITIPEGVTSIGNHAFRYCSSLTTITIPEGVTSIGEYAFGGCSSLTAITLPESVTSIGNYAFGGCSSLTAITIPEGVTSIGDCAFGGCIFLKENFVNNSSCTSSDNWDAKLFWKCEEIDGLFIFDNFIVGCRSNITVATIPEGVTSIEDYAFQCCDNLTSITLPEGVTSIGSYAFAYCYSLTSITLPEGVTTIGDYAFYNCTSLTSITIPESVNVIGSYAFEQCYNFTAVHVCSLEAWCKISFGNYSSTPGYYAPNLYMYLNGELVTELVIPEGVTSIGEWAFSGCSSLTAITLPESVTSIGNWAFANCHSLISITCEATTPPTITDNDAFYRVDRSIPVYVPAGSVEAYKVAESWNGFTNIIAVTSVTITISQYGSGTYCSKHALDFSNVEGLKAYAATGYNNITGVVTLTRVMTTQPGEGLFVKGEPGQYEVPVMESTGDNTLNMLVGIPEAEWINVTAKRIKNADFTADAGWVHSATGAYAHNGASRVAEFYSGWDNLVHTAGSLMQEVTLPAGEYRLTGKAFFRQNGGAMDNPGKSLGYMVAGDSKVLVKTLGSVEGLTAYANSIAEAGDAFYKQGLYDNVLEFTLAEETTLNIGFECTFDEFRSWFIVGEVKLEKVQPVPGAIVPLFAEQAMAFCQYGNMAMYSLPSVMAKWETLATSVNETYGAIYEGEKVLDAKVVKLMDEMTAMIAELMAIDKYYAIFNDAKWAIYDIQDNSTAKNAEVKAAFDAAVEAAIDLSTVTTIAELQDKVAALEAARQAYVVNAVPAEDFSFDYTFLVEGVGNSKNGWAWTPADAAGWGGNFQYQNNNAADTETLKKQGYVEVWSADANKGFGRLSYEAAVPNGYYTISAYAFTNGTTSFVAGDKAAAIANTGKYEAVALDSVMITNGKMNFGLDLQGAGWVGITNIELAFTAAIPDSILYGAQRDAFVARAQEFGAFVEGNASLTMMSGIKGTYAWPLFEVIDPLVADIDNVTDMALLDSMVTAMDEATAAMKQAVVVYEEYSAIVSLFWDAADNSTALNQEVADARDLALMNSNYTGMNAATVEALEAAVVEIQNAYLAYVTNAIAKDNYLFDVTFLLAAADCANKDGWTTEGAVGANSGQHWSGDNSNNYLEPCDWGATSWEASLSQTVSLPNGRYSVKAAGRASAGVTLTLHANENSVAIPAVGDVGGTIATDGTEWADVATGIAAGKTFANNNAGRGWNYVSVDAEVTEGTLTVAVKGVSATQYQWASVDDFKLYCLGVPVENGIENIETVKNAVIYTISGKRGSVQERNLG